MNDQIQEEKALLCKKIGDLCMRVPSSVANGSIQFVRQWKEDRKQAAKVVKSKRSSINELQAVYGLMEKYK